eukprot:TRINITY_DN6725_c0_g1_i1.p1 TRINITY_DN6725_c0_g1~~TRINITY_DN6725_c0_g1_i1.p1  ORF type:complete len:144 (+),score=15.99 TRINITY_DN6725_c0_g1_i1:57-434(+)
MSAQAHATRCTGAMAPVRALEVLYDVPMGDTEVEPFTPDRARGHPIPTTPGTAQEDLHECASMASLSSLGDLTSPMTPGVGRERPGDPVAAQFSGSGLVSPVLAPFSSPRPLSGGLTSPVRLVGA